MRSTPGVFLPWFSVIRLTAMALPLKECVSNRCQAFTLPQRPSCVAFTIRICSFFTTRWHCGQPMLCQVVSVAEAAHVVITFICFSSCMKFYKFSYDERPRGSQPIFMWNHIAISIHPITAWHSLFPLSATRIVSVNFTINFPLQEQYGLTMLRLSNIHELDLASSPVMLLSV